MTDKEKILNEIERLINNHDSALDYEAALEDVRNFIDSMDEEPVSEELQEAANAYISNENNYSHARTDTFKAGAEWQMEQMIALLDAAKKETNIGLNEWENGVEHGRMEVITSLTEKIEAL